MSAKANKKLAQSLLLLTAAALAAPQPAEAGKEAISVASGADAPVLAQTPGRRIPGREEPLRPEMEPIDPSKVEPPQPNLPREYVPIPDRWRLIDSLGMKTNWWDPYNQNVLKGDRPVFGKDWFINISAISDTVFEPRRVPVGRSNAGASGPGANDTFATSTQYFGSENIIASFSLIKGDTAYRPPDIELRFTPVINGTYARVQEAGVLKRDTRSGEHRYDGFIGLQEAFLDYHIRNVSDRYDFDSIRVGIQPFSSDFRGFLFQDNQLGIRLFGTRDNNIFQYNLGWFRRMDKDTNSGLNSVGKPVREDDTFVANLYIQDYPTLGFTSQITALHNRNTEGDDFFFNENDFLERPASLGDERGRNYHVTYLGYNGDGHFGRANLTVSAYWALGKDSHNQINGSDPENDDAFINAQFFAMEPSVDFDWFRLRGSFLYASGDKDPFDNQENGFSAIFENPQFAGGDTSYWIRQGIPFIGGGGVALTQRNGVLTELRTSKEHGQSNFNNPGVILAGFGTDMDLLPELRLSTNVNSLWFANTAMLETLRNQGEIDDHIGYDLSAALIYRPFQTQNVVLRLSGALLFAGKGFKDLFASGADPNEEADDIYYSVLGNVILTY
jgi:hypothetical protein